MKYQRGKTHTMCDLDEIQSEREYFWAIAFVDIDREIDRYWQTFDCELELNFQEIHGIVDDFNNFTDGEFEYDELELFIAQQIWKGKCQSNRVCNPEFTVHLKKSAPTRYLFGIFN